MPHRDAAPRTPLARAARVLGRLLTALAAVGAAALATATAVSIAAQQWWVGELLGHLRLHYAAGLALCALGLLAGHRRLAAAAAAAALVNLSVLAPLYAPPAPAAGPTTRPLRVLHYNLDKTAPEHEAAFAYLRAQTPDVLLLQEVTATLARQFARELPGYRVVHAEPRPDTLGSALLLPLGAQTAVESVATLHLPEGSPRPMIAATLVHEGRRLTVLSFHVARPKDAYTEQIQAAEYAASAGWAAEQARRGGAPLLVIGDCNSTPWSARVRGFLAAAGLRDASAGCGLQPTWPAYAPQLCLPIDHAFASPQVAALGRAVGPDLGGDHAPLLVTVALPLTP